MAVGTQRAPGLLRRQDDPDVRMMLCTAGHVDHGKTRLVGLLTGCATDRLKEERERGLTIELGFAPCQLGDGVCVGIVDVPGHEKFIKTMVAGVSGIDMTILVVAADDGVMPQTLEHLQIMSFLGVQQGIVALTKTDLVSEDRVEAVRGEIAAVLRGTPLEGGSVWPVSSETGAGIFEFYDALKAQVAGLARRKRDGLFRMPVERTFVQRGFGAVLTGIPVAGTVRVGQQVELAPGGVMGRVRGIQRFLRDADQGGFGQCLALNISELGKTTVERGQVLCEPGYLRASRMLHVQIEAVGGLEPPLRNAECVKVHTGTSECHGTIFLLEQTALSGGETALATVVLQRPLAAAAHDRLILRRPSPASTVAGGEILEVQAEGPRPRKKGLASRLRAYLACIAGLSPHDEAFDGARVHHALASLAPLGETAVELGRRLLLPHQAVEGHLAALRDEARVVEVEPGFFVEAANLGQRLQDAEERAAALERAGRAVAVSLAEFQGGLPWPQPVWRHVLSTLEKGGRIGMRENTVLLRGAARGLAEDEQRLLDRIEELYATTGFQSPRAEELPGLLGAAPGQVRKLLDMLYHERRLVRLSSQVVLSYRHFEEAQELVVRAIQEHGSLDSADFKHRIHSSRKYALAVLDYLDAQGVTIRSGNVRRLSANYKAQLR
jgi:selenocysteine-specific elongation factor